MVKIMEPANNICLIYPYTPAMINHVEKWLSKKASEGLRLEEVHGWKFTFRKCKPYITRYFSYSGFGTSMGISSEYLQSKHRYALRRSSLNKSSFEIYEVDINRIDTDYGYSVLLRNKYYLRHYLGLLVFALVCTAIAIWLTLINRILAYILICECILLAYSLFSVVVLTRAIRGSK